ncbi:MAG: Holliday junction branch migration protein RuvA [Bacteriovoracaceae bacterium]|jgi:holliday junction DNA helicase RuvA|nr:Holliday junction branch migration protein RuvA [Bacteriovoracaceae bacterium]
MIGYLKGEVIFSDGSDSIILASGVGYEVSYSKLLREGSDVSLFISHIIRENDQRFFGFSTLKDKKIFELLLKVKGVGPKSAYSLVSSIGVLETSKAILLEDVKVLQKAPGIGKKAAAQIILDMKDKLDEINLYSNCFDYPTLSVAGDKASSLDQIAFEGQSSVLNDTIMACKELGFKESEIVPVAQKLLKDHSVGGAEELVQLILKDRSQ